MEGVSIIICCYNSADRLPATIRSVAGQSVPKTIPWEVIIVNNNSADNTSEAAKLEWVKSKCNVTFRIVDEPCQGLSNARKKGISCANYEYLVFCDDDNWLDSNYVFRCFEIMKSDFKIGILGGRIDPVSDVEFPFWFSSFQHYYAVGVQALSNGDITCRRYVWGAGMVVRKRVIQEAEALNFKAVFTGRKTFSLTSGDDAELSKWALLLGYKLWYSEDLHLRHFIPQTRLCKEYLENLILENKKCDYWFNKYDILIDINNDKQPKYKQIIKGIKLYLKSYLPTNLKFEYKMRSQFLIGSKLKVSSEDDFQFINAFKKVIS